MAVIHKKGNLDGAAACGCNVFTSWKTNERMVSKRQFLYFETPERPATCKRCLGQIKRAATAPITEDMTGKIFTRSFGYDMTFNIFCKVLKHTNKGLLCQECHTNTNGMENGWTSEGRATAGSLKDSKPFIMLSKLSGYGGQYWSGGGEHWWLWDGKPRYENHCD